MFKTNKIVSSIALTLTANVFVATSVNATIIVPELTLAANTFAAADQSPSESSAQGITSVSIQSFDGNVNGSASSAAFANNSGTFLTSSNVNGNGVANATVTQQYVVSNTAQRQSFDFDFNIVAGSIDVNCFSELNIEQSNEFEDFEGPSLNSGLDGCSSAQSATSAFDADILLNGVSIWSTGAVLSIIAGVLEFTENDSFVSLGNYTEGDTRYSWVDQIFNIELGTFEAGEQFELTYIASTIATGIDSNSSIDFEEELLRNVNATARFGDPTQINANVFNATAAPTPTSQVSAPGSIALFGLALFGLAAVKRRQK